MRTWISIGAAGAVRRVPTLGSSITPGLISGADIKPGATVIDVGTTLVGGELKGDVDFDSGVQVAGAITPVPGGVGPVTNVALLRNVMKAAAGAGKVRSRRPANPLPVGRRLFLVASWLSNQLSAPVNAASAEVYESGAWPRGACASRQAGDVPERPHGYRWMTCRGMLKSVAAC